MKSVFTKWLFFFTAILYSAVVLTQPLHRTLFNDGWKFKLGETTGAETVAYNDAGWSNISLPQDWSIEFPFDSASPSGTGGGALNGGLAWYRKTFVLPANFVSGKVFIDFDGVYKNSEVWVNGHYLGKRPNGYISFEYEITAYLKPAPEKNCIAVKVDNSQQPNSRWYSGSGIYRNVWLVVKNNVHTDHWGTYITTPQVTGKFATVEITTSLVNSASTEKNIELVTSLINHAGKKVANAVSFVKLTKSNKNVVQRLRIENPALWSDTHPNLYKAITKILLNKKTLDVNTTVFGIRTFRFDPDKGFFLNGNHIKIRGVCDHHDLGCLGTAVNKRALERQLELLKGMGCNAIRTSHNPPAPELLDQADSMGFFIMDEAFDMWKKGKTKYDYHLDWDQWHKKDLEDQVLRDRNHPSVIIWSIGNEILEQWGAEEDTISFGMIRELNSIVKNLDNTRPTVTANNSPNAGNKLLQAQVTDLIGYNYAHDQWSQDSVVKRWGRKPFIITESVSALETRSHYDKFPSDSIRRWPGKHWDDPCSSCNTDLTVNAYDNVSAGWGSTHEETMKLFQKSDFISGEFIWTGFDYIGEPIPYPWPARSSYFGIIDLAGFPKDVYYMYQSVWTNKPVLHILPHWNWMRGDTIDVWAYYSQADEAELFLNGKSLGIRKKNGDDLHVVWNVPFEAGVLKAVSRKSGKVVLTEQIITAGKPAVIELDADRKHIKADGRDLSFVTVKIKDANGNIVPDANNLVCFKIQGNGFIAGIDNGLQTSMEPFKGDRRKAFNGLSLVVIQSDKHTGKIILTAQSKDLKKARIVISTAK